MNKFFVLFFLCCTIFSFAQSSDLKPEDFLISGDNQYLSQALKFYTEEMTETKRIAIAHKKKKLFPVP